MRLTQRGLNRATLHRQHLLARSARPVGDAVHDLVAVQAQHPASPYVALWSRVADFDPDALDAAFADGTLVRATLLRITLHVVHGEDWAAWHRAMEAILRASRYGDRRFADSGLTVADVDGLLPALAEFAQQPRHRAAIEEMLGERLDATRGRAAWWALRTFAPLHHVPAGGPWAYRSPSTFRAASAGGVPVDEARQRLVLRYLGAFGPATAGDITRFTSLRRPEVLAAIDGLGVAVEKLDGPAAGPYFDVVDAPRPDGDTPAPPRLLPMWDNVLLAYADRTRLVPAAYRPLIYRRNGDVLPSLLVDGRVVGVWRPHSGGIEAHAFESLDPGTWRTLAAEAAALSAVLAARDPQPYNRYAHWWAKGIPAEEVRRLPG
ncbi:winged helix DNA-binding domain-containing protein [Pseudonocardia xinjiangensis]|uniref:winged helix DNA-binding domain-containing protein n=1 Tax=Pseudonocardia xinjiangensis TaxID=75289 RepID=UPI003D92C61F